MSFLDNLFGKPKKSGPPSGKERRKGDRRFDKNQLKKKVYGDIRGLKKDRRKSS
jgi:hypothetical protein